MSNSKLTIRFNEYAELTNGKISKLTGTVNARQLLPLFNNPDILNPNPRLPKTGSVVNSIMESMEKTPETLQFKTKGILLGASQYRALDRKRFSINFVDSAIEGLQDGGHNFLALGIHSLLHEWKNRPEKAKVRRWEDFQELWSENCDDIISDIRDNVSSDNSSLNFDIPLEILVPANEDFDEREFLDGLLEICAARNNNAELTNDTIANRQGVYEFHKSTLGDLSDEIEWRSNDGGRIKSRDVIALTWIPLLQLDLPVKHKITPVKIYSSKQDCSDEFTTLMKSKKISTSESGGTYLLKNPLVGSAIKKTKTLTKAYDYLYENFPNAYNKHGSFGRIKSVKWYDPEDPENPKVMKRQPKTLFSQKPVKYSYPPAFIIPILYGLSALMKQEGDEVVWIEKPKGFLEKHLDEIVKNYKDLIVAFNYDPQVTGKSAATYSVIFREFENILLRQ